MRKRALFPKYLVTPVIILIIITACKPDMKEEETTSGDFWKNQATEKILDPWLNKGVEGKSGIFYTFLNREWGPYGGNVKYPGIVARHIYSYSAGYMLTGDQKYLDKATALKEYIIEKGWDPEYGGWYDALEEKGGVLNDSKDMFYQIYAAAGLTMYYFATHDSTALRYIKKTHDIINNQGWDKEYKGFFQTLNRDLSVETSNKTLTAQLAPISGYLLNLYQSTQEKQYLEKSEELIKLIMEKMDNNENNYVQEKFDRSWNYIYEKRADDTEINIGHNIEYMWVLLRLYNITKNEEYLNIANELWKKLRKYGYEEKNLAWYHRIGLEVPSLHTEATPWWIQAYGNMTSIYYYSITKKDKAIQIFDKGAKYWNKHFVDNEFGGVVLSVYTNGKIHKGQKAVRDKTSYHSTEHAFLNYLYTNLWVADKPVTLYFNIQTAEEGDKLYPSPLEHQSVNIEKVELNGNSWDDFDNSTGAINLPNGENLQIKVVLN